MVNGNAHGLRSQHLAGVALATALLTSCGGGGDSPAHTPASRATAAGAVADVEPQLVKPRPGTFGHLFNLPAFTPPSAALNDLGSPAGPMFDPNALDDNNPNREPAGFTYLGQFIDHDMTLDRRPLQDSPVPLNELENSREPNLNLDSVYGGGPTQNPELFDSTGRVRLSAGGRDLLRRADGSAVLFEGRNDENMVVAQVHVAIARFHNAMIDRGMTYAQARSATILHYQWVVLHDFLPRVAGQSNVTAARNGELGIYDVNNPNKKVMPVEFSVAAYRFGHSMVRRAYVLGANQGVAVQVFNPDGNDLRGGRPIPAANIIQWSNFFTIPGTTKPQPPVNVSRKIDPLLSSGLFTLPPIAIPAGGPVVLAQRNLIRGKSYGLPSGQAVARELGLTPLTNAQIGLTDARFNGEAPLWFYLLAEAQVTQNGARLGPVGGAIVADVLVGLLKKDKTGVLHPSNKNFKPITGTGFRMGDFLKIAGVAS
ncbi:peroxidase family protein [Caldimonas brevitalea]|uniref:Myeloperoxidase, thyroid peroxidase, cyclooxygenase catalytic domain n=1 Tax=Caldimonas brevitalea TaxID=413882 RepID=A0A0G3BHD5_9BURK|nr:heme peroxidase family protein [Caldimonas brevitalea]AKJ27398.1 myeloperoxidase, thyroid peroxidase, cyclooxygenase catalytic domain [Caldimonas brevitalea]